MPGMACKETCLDLCGSRGQYLFISSSRHPGTLFLNVSFPPFDSLLFSVRDPWSVFDLYSKLIALLDEFIMSAGPLETYNGTSGVANTGGDSLTQDREFLFEL